MEETTNNNATPVWYFGFGGLYCPRALVVNGASYELAAVVRAGDAPDGAELQEHLAVSVSAVDRQLAQHAARMHKIVDCAESIAELAARVVNAARDERDTVGC